MQRPPFLCRRRFSGLTAIAVIALLVVVVVVLVALLLPALNRARSGSRKAACADNLRQLAVAVHRYFEANSGMLPSSYYWGRQESLPTAGRLYRSYSEDRWQWHASLLPYLEKKDLYNSINWSFGPYEPAHRTVSEQHVDTFLCPAD